MILDKLGEIASFVNLLSGYYTILSVPQASIHNFFYYLGTYALDDFNKDALYLLITHKIQLISNGHTYHSQIWSTSSIFAPAAIPSVIKMFDRLKDNFTMNNFVKKFINVDNERFLELACRFNLLFFLKAVANNSEERLWCYPNFGRFYEQRVLPLLDLIEHKNEYKELIKKLLNESLDTFITRLPGRMNELKSMTDPMYSWESVLTWK